MKSEEFPKIRLLDSLDNILSWEANEVVTLSVIVFRLWAIYTKSLKPEDIGKNEEKSLGQCKLSELFPLRQSQQDQVIKFHPVFTIGHADYQVTSAFWEIFLRDHDRSKCIAYLNKKGASFADSFLLTDPPILIQDKQRVVSRQNVLKGNEPKIFPKGLLQEERKKCESIGSHYFVIVTDEKKRPNTSSSSSEDVDMDPAPDERGTDEELQDNEIFISYDNMLGAFGEFLTIRRAFCVDR